MKLLITILAWFAYAIFVVEHDEAEHKKMFNKQKNESRI